MILSAFASFVMVDSFGSDDCLRCELQDFAGTVADRMDAIHPGFRRAYLYPGMAEPIRVSS